MHTHTPPALRISIASHTYRRTHARSATSERKSRQEGRWKRGRKGGSLGRKRKEMTRKD